MTMRRPLALLFALGLAASGCEGCDTNPLDGEDAGKGGGDTIRRDASMGDEDAGTPDAAMTIPDAGTPDAAMMTPDAAVEMRTLTFTGTNPLTAYFGTMTDLTFRLTRSGGMAVENGVINFALGGSGGTLSVAQVFTDSNGEGTVRFTAGSAAGTATITASSQFASNVQVGVNVLQDPNASINFRLESQTRIQVQRSEALFFTGANPQTCAQLAMAATLPTASFNAQFNVIPGVRVFPSQTIGHKVTVLAHGYDQYNQQFATACVDNITLVGGMNNVTVQLQQGPSDVTGDYDVLLQVDLGDALPEPYESTVGTVINVISDPAGYGVYLALRYADENSSGFTDFLIHDPDGPGPEGERINTYEEVAANPAPFNVWRNVRTLLDNALTNQFGETYTTLRDIGEDVAGLITKFEVGARYTITEVPNSSPGHHVEELWHEFVFTWQRGCPQGDLGCARRPIRLTDVNRAPVSTEYDALVSHDPLLGMDNMVIESERFRVDPQNHPIALNYGAVILTAFEEIVFPSVTGDPNVNSLSGVLAHYIDCMAIGQWISNETGGIVDAQTGINFCVGGLGTVANTIEIQLTNLTLGGGDLQGKENPGATGFGVFYLVDADHDLQTELVRDVEQYIQWTDPNDPNLSEDVTAPIIGEGRREASDCGTDLECPTGRVCTAIPHYLKVRRLETDCRRPLGSGVGLSPCTMNSACQSGLCIGAVMGMTGFCHEACRDVGSCSVGTCQDDVLAIDLDPILMGLGTATAPSCVN